MEKRLTFAYGRALLVSRGVFLGAVIVLALVAVALLPPLSVELIALPAGLLSLYFVLFAVSPSLTEHWLTRSRLILRQGWYFRVVVPFSEIEDVRSMDESGPGRIPLGLHRPLGRPTLYVTGARTGLVAIRLRRPMRFWQAFGLPATEVVFDVAQPTLFVAALEERRRLLPPVEAERADA